MSLMVLISDIIIVNIRADIILWQCYLFLCFSTMQIKFLAPFWKVGFIKLSGQEDYCNFRIFDKHSMLYIVMYNVWLQNIWNFDRVVYGYPNSKSQIIISNLKSWLEKVVILYAVTTTRYISFIKW